MSDDKQPPADLLAESLSYATLEQLWLEISRRHRDALLVYVNPQFELGGFYSARYAAIGLLESAREMLDQINKPAQEPNELAGQDEGSADVRDEE